MKRFFSLLVIFLIFIITIVPVVQGAGIGLKWQNPKRIKTYIPPNNKRTVMMKHAFAEWSRLTQNKVIFVYTPDKKAAQIDVQFVKSIPNADREIGLTKSMGVPPYFSHATIFIADNTTQGHTLGKDSVYTVMLHEIGHAIGLDHTGNILSIMYPMEDDRQEILKMDLKALGEIYGWNK